MDQKFIKVSEDKWGAKFVNVAHIVFVGVENNDQGEQTMTLFLTEEGGEYRKMTVPDKEARRIRMALGVRLSSDPTPPVGATISNL